MDVPKIATAVLALALGACEMRLPHAKTPPPPQQPAVAEAAPPPPSPQPAGPLSIPQTQVSLPPPQPIDPEALAMPPILVETPATHTQHRAPRRPAASAAPPAANPPKTEPVETAEAPPPDQPRPPIQPVLPDGERRQRQEDVASRLREVEQDLAKIVALHLPNAADNISKIKTFADSAQKAMETGDILLADGASKRALLLAQELLSGR